MEQKLESTKKQITNLNNAGIAFKKQSDKQLEQIRKYEELHQNLTTQTVLHFLITLAKTRNFGFKKLYRARKREAKPERYGRTSL